MQETLKVEFIELMTRANEVEAPLPDPPKSVPEAPCGLRFVREATIDLAATAASLREYLGYGAKERERLATSLRNAAKAYATVDEDAAASIDGGKGSVSEMTLEDGARDTATLDDAPVLRAAATPDDYRDLLGRCQEIEGGDQGASLLHFGEEWVAYGRTLRDTTARFRRFDHWEGESTRTVESNFEDHKRWIGRMADLCQKVGNEAQTVVSVHRAAEAKHIIYTGQVPWRFKVNKSEQIAYIEEQYPLYPQSQPQFMLVLARLQEISDEVISEYQGKIDVRPDTGIAPPTASRIDPPPPPPGPGPEPGPWDFLDDLQVPETPSLPQVPNFNKPEMPTDMPLMDAALTDDLAGAAGKSSGGVKPASFGGGGMPLQPAIDPDVAARAAAASRDAAGLGRGLAGAGAGGGMGGMPMGGAPGGGKGKDGGQAKRTQGDEESLYTEDRAWTEGIIGRRRPPKEAPENKDFK
jgi:hypothetical protein